MQSDDAYLAAERKKEATRRILHRLRQNIQKKTLSIEYQKRRLEQTQLAYADCVESEKLHRMELAEVEKSIEAIKTQHAGRLPEL